MDIKPLEKNHWEEVKKIYQEGINSRLATFETEVPSWEVWDQNHHSFCRYVMMDEDTVAGWIALLPVSKREVYRGVAEVSIYISNAYHGKGVGKSLMSYLIEESEKREIRTLQCSLFRENQASYNLHTKFGFREIGYREKVAKLDNVWRDTVLMERRSKIAGI